MRGWLRDHRPYLLDMAIALVAVAIAGGLRLWPLDMLGERVPFLTFYPAIIFVAMLRGLVAGLLATLFSVLFLYLVNPGVQSFLQDVGDDIGLAIYLVSGLLIAFIGDSARQSRVRKLEADILIQQFSSALDHISAYIYIKDRQHRYVYANRHTLELFGRTKTTIRGAEDAEFFPPATVQRLCEVDTRVMERAEHTAEEIVVPMEDGESRIYWEVKSPIYDDVKDGRIIGLCGISTDITQQKQKEAELQESVERFRAIFDAAAIGMALVGLDGRFMQVNDALCDIVGYDSDALKRLTYQDITHPDDLKADQMLVQELIDGKREHYHLEKRYIHRDGRSIWILLSGAKVTDASGRLLYFIAQIQDISRQKALIEALEIQARHDSLTGLNNRRHFIALCEAELFRAKRYRVALSMLMLDIDHFKQVNDEHGHKAGDLVLVQLGSIMRMTLRNVDVIGRYGGEEFAIMLPETDRDMALDVAERLRQEIAEADFVLEAGETIKVTVSIGVSSSGDAETNIDRLISAADQALYRAKNSGRNRVVQSDTL